MLKIILTIYLLAFGSACSLLGKDSGPQIPAVKKVQAISEVKEVESISEVRKAKTQSSKELGLKKKFK